MDESIVKFLERTKVGTLKLSEAIREGIRMRPRECSHSFFDGDDASCLWGAAWVAIGNPGKGSSLPTGVSLWMAKRFGVPEMVCIEAHLMHGGSGTTSTREQIADWLAAQGY